MTVPTVSVIMATYNGASLVEETVCSLLRQRFDDFELIAVDDCSTDRTVAALHSFGDRRIRVLSTECNAGPVAARNLAVAAARGRYIAGLDQDDLSHPDRLGRQVAYLDGHPDIAVLGTAARRLVGHRLLRDQFPRRTTPGLLRWMLHVNNPMVWSSIMMRGEAVRALPVFQRVERQYAEDFDLYHRLAPYGDIARLDDVLTTYRYHENGASQTQKSRMIASSTAILADAHALLVHMPGPDMPMPACDAIDDAKHTASLLTRHLAAREPAPDYDIMREVRNRLQAATVALERCFRPDRETRRLIAAETGRMLRTLAWGTVNADLRRRLSASQTADLSAA